MIRVMKYHSGRDGMPVTDLNDNRDVLGRQKIDAQFASMAHDPTYRKLAEQMCAEFSESDRQTLRIADSKLQKRLSDQ